jgi:amino acid adenylation domain-containing protein
MMIVGLLGILKAGGGYLPLDSGYPAQRLAFMIEDSQIRILLTQNSLLSQLPQAVATVICLDTDWQHIAQQSQENLVYSTQLENLVYVIYTSGSTGKPKGVQVLQRGLVNFLLSMQRTFGFSSHDKFLAITTISFDIAGLELFLPLICGAQVMLVSREVATDAAQLIQLLPKVTVMQATPATWRMLLAAGWQGKTALTLLCGGEALTTELSEQLLARSSAVWNMYGPTETTVWSSCYRVIPAVETARGKTTEFIGHPIDNTQFYILDQQLQPVPIGVIGELHITGDGIAQGYLHRDALTAEKFIANPFQTPHDGMYTAKLYKTGDLARYRDNGVVECLGRTDNQIKLRGFRIELGEIEAVVAQHPDVQEVAVTVQTISGDKRLVAYLVLKRPVPHLAETLREFLREKLPEYMLPAIFVDLEGLPHTPSGKIDRHRLPAPTQNRQLSTRTFVAPRDEIEAQLVVIFEKLLNTHPISVADNFFDLGGHSLLGVTLLYQVQQTFHKDISLMALFRHPTIEQLAELIKAQGYIREWCALEPIRTEGQGKAFFFIGSTNYARVLAPLMQNTHPIYGLNIFGLQDGIAFRHNLSIESIAQHYVKEIEGLQPDGPYYLCAYCADTAIVYEMARALMARGKPVGLVAFLDSIWEPNDLYFGLYRHWRNLQNFGLSYIGHKIGSRLYFMQLSWSLRLNRWMKKLYKTLGKTASREQQDMSFISQFYEALERYTPTALPGLKVTLFLSCEWRWKYSPALEKLTGESVKIYEIPVYHDNMFVEPCILELATKIDHCLQAADAYYHVTPTAE